MRLREIKFILAFVLIIISYPIMGKVVFKQVQQWNHGDKELYSTIFCPIITNDGSLVIRDGKQKWSIVITPKETFYFAPMGQGPSDIYLALSACNYSNDIAYLESSKRIKVFTKKDNTYTWKETIWLKSSYTPIVRDILFYKDKWFFAGVNTKFYDAKKAIRSFFLLGVFRKNGEQIKGLIHMVVPDKEDYVQMDYFLALNRSRVFFMAEKELKAYEIDAEKVDILREVNLETPGFYKKMPADFYLLKDQNMDTQRYDRDIDNWKVSYSIITNIDADSGYLAVQVRTCSDKLKKFALLFYDVDTLKLQNTFFTDDFFIGARNGIFYFYAKGIPKYEEEADKCIINLYSFMEEKKK